MVGENTEIGYIYSLSSSKDDLVRYVGYSQNPKERLIAHLQESKKLKYVRHKWIQKEISIGNKIKLEILKTCPYSQIGLHETETILLYKSIGARLTNGNNGGVGGQKNPSESTRQKMRDAMTGNTWNIGRTPSKKNRDALMRVLVGRTVSEDVKKNMSNAQKELIKKRKESGDQILNLHDRILSEEDVISIFDLINIKKLSIKEASKQLNINESTIKNVYYNKRYYKDFKLKNNL